MATFYMIWRNTSLKENVYFVPVNVNTPPVKAAVCIKAKLQLKQQLWHNLNIRLSVEKLKVGAGL